MTYPPQQPPGPYDPNQNPYGQQPQQQPGWQQQQPPQGYDAYGPQQPPPGYDAYGQPTQQYNPYGQPTQQYGYPGGYPQPPKKKTGLLVGLAVAGVLVVGGGITTFALLSGDDNGSDNPGTTNVADSSPAGTAEELVARAVKAIGERDVKAATALMCDPSRPGPAAELNQLPPGATIRARQDTEIRHSGASATAKLDLSVAQNGRTIGNSTLTLRMTEKPPGKWCVDRASMDSGASTARRPPSTRPTS
jgi:hypothetical protein